MVLWIESGTPHLLDDEDITVNYIQATEMKITIPFDLVMPFQAMSWVHTDIPTIADSYGEVTYSNNSPGRRVFDIVDLPIKQALEKQSLGMLLFKCGPLTLGLSKELRPKKRTARIHYRFSVGFKGHDSSSYNIGSSSVSAHDFEIQLFDEADTQLTPLFRYFSGSKVDVMEEPAQNFAAQYAAIVNNRRLVGSVDWVNDFTNSQNNFLILMISLTVVKVPIETRPYVFDMQYYINKAGLSETYTNEGWIVATRQKILFYILYFLSFQSFASEDVADAPIVIVPTPTPSTVPVYAVDSGLLPQNPIADHERPLPEISSKEFRHTGDKPPSEVKHDDEAHDDPFTYNEPVLFTADNTQEKPLLGMKRNLGDRFAFNEADSFMNPWKGVGRVFASEGLSETNLGEQIDTTSKKASARPTFVSDRPTTRPPQPKLSIAEVTLAETLFTKFGTSPADMWQHKQTAETHAHGVSKAMEEEKKKRRKLGFLDLYK